jgi:hypothetical protein
MKKSSTRTQERKPSGCMVDPGGSPARRIVAALLICFALAGSGAPLLAADTGTVTTISIWDALASVLQGWWSALVGEAVEPVPPPDDDVVASPTDPIPPPVPKCGAGIDPTGGCKP